MKFDVITVELPNQVKLQYVEQGNSSGLPLILLHGYAESWRSFERVLPHLPKSIRTFALTQRGHGDASRPVTGYRPLDFENDLVGFMDALELNTAVIAGGSSGGIIARRFAIDYPNRTSGLILVGSPLTLQDKPFILDIWTSTISNLKDPIDPNFVGEFIKSTLAQQVPQEFLKTMIKENLKVPARVWTATLRGFLEDDSSKELNKIKTPTLIVWGDKDAIIPRSEQETMLERIVNSRLVVYPDAGHALYWEEPAHFASDIVAFIKTLDH
jgi:pimeloyl-ACP methyl ester carboxylesterase